MCCAIWHRLEIWVLFEEGSWGPRNSQESGRTWDRVCVSSNCGRRPILQWSLQVVQSWEECNFYSMMSRVRPCFCNPNHHLICLLIWTWIDSFFQCTFVLSIVSDLEKLPRQNIKNKCHHLGGWGKEYSYNNSEYTWHPDRWGSIILLVTNQLVLLSEKEGFGLYRWLLLISWSSWLKS